MVPIRMMCAAMIVAASLTSSALSAMVVAARVSVPFDNAQVIVRFNRAKPGHLGNFFFMGAGERFNITLPAHNSHATALGQLLFDARGRKRSPVTLPGVYNRGNILHFAYDVVRPRDYNDDVFRSVIRSDRKQFSYNRATGRMGIEDFRRGWRFNDDDYSDLIVRILFRPVEVPTPGSMALMGVAALACLRPRRRR
jgi:hypothetical protein